jgi:hypothetical protein
MLLALRRRALSGLGPQEKPNLKARRPRALSRLRTRALQIVTDKYP